MAHINPRDAEVDAMLAVLEPYGTGHLDPEEYDDARKVASDLLKAAYQILRLRDWYVVGHQAGASEDWNPNGMSLVYGMEATEHAAHVLADYIVATTGYGITAIKRVYGASALQADVAAQAALAKDQFADDPCAACGHLRVHHGAVKTVRGKLVTDTKPAKFPCSGRCSCALFVVTPPPAAPTVAIG